MQQHGSARTTHGRRVIGRRIGNAAVLDDLGVVNAASQRQCVEMDDVRPKVFKNFSKAFGFPERAAAIKVHSLLRPMRMRTVDSISDFFPGAGAGGRFRVIKDRSDVAGFDLRPTQPVDIDFGAADALRQETGWQMQYPHVQAGLFASMYNVSIA